MLHGVHAGFTHVLVRHVTLRCPISPTVSVVCPPCNRFLLPPNAKHIRGDCAAPEAPLLRGFLRPLGFGLVLADIVASQSPPRRKRKQKVTLMEPLENDAVEEPEPEVEEPEDEYAAEYEEAEAEEEEPTAPEETRDDAMVTSNGAHPGMNQCASHQTHATGPQTVPSRPPEESTADDESYANGLFVSEYSTGVSYARYVRPRVLHECTSMSNITNEIRGRDRLKRLVPTSFTYGGYRSRTGQTTRFSEGMY